MFEAWAIVDQRITCYHLDDSENVGGYPNLVHPCNMRNEILKELIPPTLNTEEVLELVSIKQKEIARRLNISKLPSDRPTGWLGQTALFEILKEKGFNFKSYVQDWPTQWFRSQALGFNLIMSLGYLYYIRRFFGCQPIDLVKYIIEPISDYQFAMTWDDNWVQRIYHNILAVTPNYLPNKHIHKILSELMLIQDKWGATVNRVMKWTGLSRRDATHIRNVLRTGWCEHRFRIVSKNTGIVKVLTKSKSKWKKVPSFFAVCTSLDDDEDYFVSVTDIFKKDAEEKYFEWEGANTNVELFDLKDQIWKLGSSITAKNVDDILALIQNGEHTIPDSDIPPTSRDLFLMALLLAMDTTHHAKKNQEIMEWLTVGYGVPAEEAEKGIRNILRKNMLRNQYTHYAIMGPDREMLTILFDDKSEKVIPFLGEVLPSIPFFWIRTDPEMGYGHLFEYHPTHLSKDIRNLIESSLREHDVNAETLVTKSWTFGYPGSLLRLIPDQ
jgi:hypothetical protein